MALTPRQRLSVRFLPPPSPTARALAFSPTGEYLAVGTNSRALRVCAMGGDRSGKPILEKADCHQGSVFCAAWSVSGALLATGSNDHTVRLLRLRRGGGASALLKAASTEVLRGHDGTVRDLGFSPVADTMATAGSGDCCVRLWDCERAGAIASLKGHTAPVLSVKVVRARRGGKAASAEMREETDGSHIASLSACPLVAGRRRPHHHDGGLRRLRADLGPEDERVRPLHRRVLRPRAGAHLHGDRPGAEGERLGL